MSIATPSGRLTTAGKQVLLDGEHLCDARDEVAATAIAHALDFSGVAFGGMPTEATKAIWAVLS
jgi:hypothetical protein